MNSVCLLCLSNRIETCDIHLLSVALATITGTIIESRDSSSFSDVQNVGVKFEVTVEDVDAVKTQEDTSKPEVHGDEESAEAQDYRNEVSILLSEVNGDDADQPEISPTSVPQTLVSPAAETTPVATPSVEVEGNDSNRKGELVPSSTNLKAFAQSVGLNSSSISLLSTSPMENSYIDSMVIDPSWSASDSAVTSPTMASENGNEMENKEDDVLTDLPRLSANNSDIDLAAYSLSRQQSSRSATTTLLSVCTSESSRSSSIGSFPDDHADLCQHGHKSQASGSSGKSFADGSFLEMSSDVAAEEGVVAPRSTMYRISTRASEVLDDDRTSHARKRREFMLDMRLGEASDISQQQLGTLLESSYDIHDVDFASPRQSVTEDILEGIGLDDDASEDDHTFRESIVPRIPSVVEADSLDAVRSYAPSQGQGGSSDRQYYGGGRGSGYNSGGKGYGGGGRGDSHGDWRGGDWGRSSSGGRNNTNAPSGSGRGRDDDGDKGRRPSRPSNVSSSVQTSDSEETSASETEDDYGEESPSVQLSTFMPTEPRAQLRNGRKGVYRRPSCELKHGSSSVPKTPNEDDDMPLAQRIPGALVAQKSIRRQVRDERAKKKQDRLAHVTPPTYLPEGQLLSERGRPLSPRVTPQPQSAVPAAGPSTMSSSQEAAMHAMRSDAQKPAFVRRHRARTIGEGSISGVPADDLTRRLLQIQAVGSTPSPVQPRMDAAAHRFRSPDQEVRPPHAAFPRRDRSVDPLTLSTHRRISPPPPMPDQHRAEVPARPLRAQRSLNFPKRNISPNKAVPAMPFTPQGEHQLGRSNTTKSRRTPESRSGRDDFLDFRPSANARPSTEGSRPSREVLSDLETPSHQRTSASRPAVPPVPDNEATRITPRGISTTSSMQPGSLVQTKIFIGDMQRFNTVIVGPEMNAKEALEMIRSQGELREDGFSGSWMLWEVSQDFGLGKFCFLQWYRRP